MEVHSEKQQNTNNQKHRVQRDEATSAQTVQDSRMPIGNYDYTTIQIPPFTLSLV